MFWPFKSRYVASLESEVARLQNRERELINSILGMAGVPPIEKAADENPPEPIRRGSWRTIGRRQTALTAEASRMVKPFVEATAERTKKNATA